MCCARFVITLTSTPGCTACPSGSESAGGAVTECACKANYHDTGDPALYAKVTSAYHIDGGGWKLVRRVKSGTTWHQATDHLAGTASYGTYTTDEDSDSTFSIPFYFLLHDIFGGAAARAPRCS